jgi:hypothetical protein
MYSDKSTGHAITHLLKVHKITKRGRISENMEVSHRRNPNSPTITVDPGVLKEMLLRWTVEQNVSYQQIESERFREILTYLSSTVSSSLSRLTIMGHALLTSQSIGT